MRILWLTLIITGMVFPQADMPEAIADNSFLIEEAYNQESRVVQHISNLVYARPSKDWNFAFTQEWPFFSPNHQLSYTIPYASQHQANRSGVGDILINYRYQLTGEESVVTLAPRLSVILPTGDDEKGFGSGATGIQFNLPASRRMSAMWVAHANLGVTITPGVKIGTDKKTIKAYHAGASVIWLARTDFNVMLEWFSLFEDTPDASGALKNKASHVVSPGLRYAHNFGSLQVVPGIAYTLQTDGDEKGLFMYLSFEHPF